jgi:y4mF family transcriptional regulator
MTYYQEISEVVKMHRKAAGLSRNQLAELAGVGKTVIYDVEKGKQSVRLNTLQKILNVLNIKIILTSPLLETLREQGNEES